MCRIVGAHFKLQCFICNIEQIYVCDLTESDEKNDLRSTDRKLDRRLVLLVKQKLGSGQHWVMPMGVHSHGESMRQVFDGGTVVIFIKRFIFCRRF